MSKLAIRPVGMTLERALEIATACLPPLPESARLDVTAAVEQLHGQKLTDPQICEALHLTRAQVRTARAALGLPSNYTKRLRDGVCPSGHEFTAANTALTSGGFRRCRECDRLRSRRPGRRKNINKKAGK